MFTILTTSACGNSIKGAKSSETAGTKSSAAAGSKSPAIAGTKTEAAASVSEPSPPVAKLPQSPSSKNGSPGSPLIPSQEPSQLSKAPPGSKLSSGGSGGALTNHVVTIDGVEVKVYPSSKMTKPARLAVWLHGDNASGYNNDIIFDELIKYSEQNGLLFIAALAPNRSSWWTAKVHADNFAHVIDALHAKYDIDKTKTLYSGVSGGSDFMTIHFLPKYGFKYPGDVALTCGGSNALPFSYAVTPEIARSIRLHYVYGDKDFLAIPDGPYGPQILYSIDTYTKKGFSVTKEVLPGKRHCEFDTYVKITEAWTTFLKP